MASAWHIEKHTYIHAHTYKKTITLKYVHVFQF